MQIPPGAATVWLAAFSSTLGKCAAHQPVAGGQLSDARAKSPFVGRELQAGNRGVGWPIHLIYIYNTRLLSPVKPKNPIRKCSHPGLGRKKLPNQRIGAHSDVKLRNRCRKRGGI